MSTCCIIRPFSPNISQNIASWILLIWRTIPEVAEKCSKQWLLSKNKKKKKATSIYSPMTLGNWSHDVFLVYNYKEFVISSFLKRLNWYSIPLFQGKVQFGSATIVQILFDHGLEFQHISYYRNALEESIRTRNVHLTKILREMKINPFLAGIVCVISNI